MNYAIRAISQQAKRAIIFNGNDPRFAKRVTLNIQNSPVMDAISTVLKGTGLEATTGPDGETIIIRGEELKAKSQSATTSHIVGVVIDSTTRKGIPGVTVTISKIRRSVVTQEGGAFRISDVPTGQYTLSAKLIGYQSATAQVTTDSGRTATVQVVLTQMSTTLSEIVTTATGAQRRIEISNDVVKINADKLIQAAPIQNVTDLLVAAQVPGMIVTRSSGDPGAPARIRLGGPGSISQNNDPVVIVDGVWINSAFSTDEVKRKLPASASTSQSLPSRLDAIDPATIESIEIVRGPSAATLYGPDAANGVIKITTKRGQAGPARWDFRGFRTWASPGGTQPLQYYAYGRNEMSTAPIECTLINAILKACVQDSVLSFRPSDPFLRNEDAGFTNGYSLTVSGGTTLAGRNAMMYSLTASMQDQLGTRRIPAVDRVRFRQLGIALSNQMLNPSEKRDRTMSTRLTLTPKAGYDISLNLDGSQTNSRENHIGVSPSGSSKLGRFDTLTTLNRVLGVSPATSRATSTRGLASLTANLTPFVWWNSNVTIGLDRGYTKENRDGLGKSCFEGVCTDGVRTVAAVNGEYSVYTARVQSSFLPDLGWASRFLSIRPGFSADIQRTVRGDRSFNYEVGTNGATTPLGVTVEDGRVQALAGVALSANIRLFDRLSFDPAIRRDFGSRRNLRNNAKTYPRFGTSWLISDEAFFPRQQFLSLLRLRMAMGFAAVQPNYASVYGGYLERPTILNGQAVSRIDLTQVGNPNLEPERSFELETGFDADLLGDRVMLTVTYANKQNKNTLIDRTLAPSAGAGSSSRRQENIARVVNQTTSVQVTGRVIDRPGVFLQLTTNFSLLDNTIKTLGDGVSPFGSNEQRYVAGYPVGGLWQRPLLAIHDTNGNGILEDGEWILGDSVEYVGTNLPRFTAGYRAELRVFNHVTVSAMLNYKGRYMQNRSNKFNETRGYWDPSASLDDQVVTKLIGGNAQDRQPVSEVRLQSASVTVNVPPHLTRQLRARSLQISLQGSNLGLWTQYRGRDPGVNSSIIGERTTDNGLTIAPSRDVVLQFRLGY